MRSSTETLIAVMRGLSDISQLAIREAAERLEEQQRTLKVIRTWTEFYRESPAEYAKTLVQIRDKCDQILD